jgi:hypothetical protein
VTYATILQTHTASITLLHADGYGINDVLYFWTHGPDNSIKMASDMTLSQFDLVGFPADNETAKRPGGKISERGHKNLLFIHT